MFNYKDLNYYLIVLPVLLFSLGYVLHLSTSQQRATSQLIFFVMGYIIFWIISLLDYRIFVLFYNNFFKFLLVTLIILLIIGEAKLGAVRWFSLGVLKFQPSEIAKIALVIYSAFVISLDRKFFSDRKKMILYFMNVLTLVLLVLLQPDLGTSIILFCTFTGILFMAGLKWIYFFYAFCFFGLFSTPLWYMLKDYQQHRILIFLNPYQDTLGRGYNVIQSLIALGTGGLWGVGFGHGSQSHLNFLPIYWTDFAFAAFGEEWGFFGIFLLIMIFGILLYTILYVAAASGEKLGALLTYGAFMVIFSQFVINIGMNMGMLPVTGIPLPFISYGGTSMVTSFALMGIVHSVWLNRKKL